MGVVALAESMLSEVEGVGMTWGASVGGTGGTVLET